MLGSGERKLTLRDNCVSVSPRTGGGHELIAETNQMTLTVEFRECGGDSGQEVLSRTSSPRSIYV